MVQRRTLLASSLGAAAVGGGAFSLAAGSPTVAQARPGGHGPGDHGPGGDGSILRRWASDTWRCLTAMTDPDTGLAADLIDGALEPDTRSVNTSPTNIGGLLWGAVVARELHLITTRQCAAVVGRTLKTLLRMEHHEPSGMYYNWYDIRDGSVLTTWPGSGDRVYPFVSSVDNGWLGAALQVVRTAVPQVRRDAERLWRRMRWDMFYDPDANRPGGLIHGGFYTDPPPPGQSVFTGNHIGRGPDVWYTDHHYDTCVSETRITTYLGLIRGQVPAKNYFTLWRTFPATEDWDWHEMQPTGVTRRYAGQEVYEGAYTYKSSPHARGLRVVPGWGGSMFEELMPDVFVPETAWAPRSWGRNHGRHVRAQIEHGMVEAGYGYWGFSPCANPAGGYREYGVDQLGLNPDGYFSDQESTNYDRGFGSFREGTNPDPDYGDGVVTPHASFLAMMHDRPAAIANLLRIERRLDGYGPGGFYDAVATRSGTVARWHLSLDQAMIMGALGNVLGRDVVRRAFATREVEHALRPVIGQEQFGV